ncbi:MAG TPA: acyltransferase, partial [Labilithrix sp.]|nr:acyltransferase [Labilithrix sp.]
MQGRHAMGHVPGLDGLRGIAVMGVLVFHANARLRGGYLGVDLFFVLSGFLITSILIEEHRATGAVDLRRFWVRRARRLMPALLSLMPAIALYAKIFARPAELAALRGDALATIGYVANWRAIFVHRSYWDMFLAPSPLEHTWSLAIEEQFYVVWPLAVAAILARARGTVRGARAVCGVSVVLAVASAATMALLYEGGNTSRIYLGTDTRGAAILLGAALATSGLTTRPENPSARAERWLDVVALGSMLYLAAAWWWLDGQSELLYRGGFWTTEVAALVLIVASVRAPGGMVARLLSLRPLRAMGAISYGVYLWHWPIYCVLTEERVGLGGARLLALRLALTIAVASVSYRFLEQPIRQRGLSWGRPVIVVPASFVLAIAFVIGATQGAVAAPADPLAAGKEGAIVFTPASATAPVAPPDAAPLADAGTPMKVLVVGDSVGIALGGRMG